MNGQITTVAQLSGYPLGAVFTDIEGGVWMIDSRNPATGACWMLPPETVRMSAKHVLRKWGPLTPVWRPDQAVGSPKVAAKPTAKIDDGHTCDAGHFDRTICPEPCGTMHSYCSTCGSLQDECPNVGLALIPPQRCAPSEDELAKAVTSGWVEGFDEFGKYGPQFDSALAARAVAKLYGDQPTVAQAKADALREAAMDWTDFDAAAMGTPAAWFRARAAAIEKGAQ